VRDLLAGLEVEGCDEEEAEGVTPLGEAKRWHLWRVVARRPSS
jgi:tellurite methyltransferase